jgi:DNA uptake protein ComE-like DNA-binding protein
MSQQPTNEEIAALLERIGQLLETNETNPYRVRAYFSAAATVRGEDKPVAELANDHAALTRLPGIGDSLAGLISQYVETGQSALLRELEAAADGGTVFDTVPGLGETLARRIAETLDIRTLEELERAAHDGRLDKVAGFGPARVRAVQTALAGMLSNTAQRRARQRTAEESDAVEAEPSVALLLDVDAEYRRQAAAGDLDTIAPKRFNPEGKAWLPILHTQRGVWAFTALFSNTARAHEAGKINDWVVIYFERQGQGEEQRTVITQAQGPLAGRRVVRGREAETRDHYAVESAS